MTIRVCVFGAGAIGGYMGAKLAAADAEVTLIARGPHLAAMQTHGLRLREGCIVVLVAHRIPRFDGAVHIRAGQDDGLRQAFQAQVSQQLVLVHPLARRHVHVADFPGGFPQQVGGLRRADRSTGLDRNGEVLDLGGDGRDLGLAAQTGGEQQGSEHGQDQQRCSVQFHG